MITEQTMKKYKDIVTCITIDRGCGNESFPVIDAKEQKGCTLYYIGNTDWIDKDFLNSCSYVKFHVKQEYDVEVKNNLTYTFTTDEIHNIIDTLLDVYDRLLEVKNVPSIIEDCDKLPNDIQEIKRMLIMRRYEEDMKIKYLTNNNKHDIVVM